VDCGFDLSLHLRRIGAPSLCSPDPVVEFARSEAMTGFDPTRPLWQLTLIEGLEGDRAAPVIKVHHSLTDGVGGMQLAMLVFEMSAVTAPIEEVPVPAAAPVPSCPGWAWLRERSATTSVQPSGPHGAALPKWGPWPARSPGTPCAPCLTS
jgi:hypothetical protein